MSSSFNLRITINADEVNAAIRGKVERVKAVLVKAVNQETTALTTYIQDEKLAGQVLNRRTRNLVRSVHTVPASMTGAIIRGEVRSSGGVAWYGRIHEFGGTFTIHRGPRTGRTITFPERSFMRSALADRRTAIIERIKGSARTATA